VRKELAALKGSLTHPTQPPPSPTPTPRVAHTRCWPAPMSVKPHKMDAKMKAVSFGLLVVAYLG
jgi:hypothetical protein